MRLWSLHPCYLDPAGLTACWREGLLARAVLTGATRGYRNHPQLTRFRACKEPLQTLDAYLSEVLVEAQKRGYRFDASKIDRYQKQIDKVPITLGQLEYEFNHLRAKLERRNPAFLATWPEREEVLPHPLFQVIEGDVEPWEIRR